MFRLSLSPDPKIHASDHSKNESHGDNGRAEQKAEKQINDLLEQLKNTTGKDSKIIKKKIENIKKAAQRKRKGENHSRKGKG